MDVPRRVRLATAVCRGCGYCLICVIGRVPARQSAPSKITKSTVGHPMPCRVCEDALKGGCRRAARTEFDITTSSLCPPHESSGTQAQPRSTGIPISPPRHSWHRTTSRALLASPGPKVPRAARPRLHPSGAPATPRPRRPPGPDITRSPATHLDADAQASQALRPLECGSRTNRLSNLMWLPCRRRLNASTIRPPRPAPSRAPDVAPRLPATPDARNSARTPSSRPSV